MDVWQGDQYPWLNEEIAAIRHWVHELGKPYVGICLGHQLLAEALGVTRIPEGGEILAENAHCPVQAFAWGHHAYGFQYHCEITSSTTDEWNTVPAYRDSLKVALGDDSAPRLAEEVSNNLSSLSGAARTLYDNLARIMNESEKR